MKKLFYYSIICLGTSVYASETMEAIAEKLGDKVSIERSEEISTSKEVSSLSIKDLEKLPSSELVLLINYRRLLSPIPKGLDPATVKIGEYVKLSDGTRFPVAVTNYTLKRTLVHYDHNFHLGYSIPVYKLYIEIKNRGGTGIVVIDRRHVDSSLELEHIERLGGYEFNDHFLEALPLTLISMKLDEGNEIVIDPPKLREAARPIPYKLVKSDVDINLDENLVINSDSFIDRRNGYVEIMRRRDDGCIEVMRRRPIVREYLRPDGTKILKNWSEVIEFNSTRYDSRYISAPDGGDNVRVYHRLDGTELLLDWRGKALQERPRPQCFPPPRRRPGECIIV